MDLRGRFRLGSGIVHAAWLAALTMLVACSPAGTHPPQVTDHGRTEPHHSPYVAEDQSEDSQNSLKVLDLNALLNVDAIIPTLANKQVVFIGETHDRYDHHLNQLELIRRLHQIHPDLVIGMEYFQQPFQQYLDDYIAGELTEKELLRGTEYYSRWQFDYRLYRPILEYAKRHRIPLIALNVPREITDKVARNGLDGLTDKERQTLPKEIDHSDKDYEGRLKEIFQQHPNSAEKDFENFLAVQLLWDEGMADRAAQYIQANPNRYMIILAGSGHLAHGSGIPQRLQRRIRGNSAIVLNAGDTGVEPGVADFILMPRGVELPPAGMLGIYMHDSEDGVTVSEFADKSAAKDKGIKKGDRIVEMDGQPVHSAADAKLALLDKQPGDTVEVNVRREDESQNRLFVVNLR